MGGNPYDKDNLRLLCKDCHKAKTKLDQDVLNSI
ncbi:HNH endonuclease [Candidatus Woesearchaeota archaeon]|nr:HNH endonuclease [Candidatus Woesearchaeota archaeon]